MKVHENFRIGDVVSFESKHKEIFAVVIGGSFLGPPSFTGVLHVYCDSEILAIDPSTIRSVYFKSQGTEVEFI